MFGIEIAVEKAIRSIQDAKEEQRIIQSLPPDLAKKILKKRAKERRRIQKYQEKLAIAREGRPLNFWGNR